MLTTTPVVTPVTLSPIVSQLTLSAPTTPVDRKATVTEIPSDTETVTPPEFTRKNSKRGEVYV